MANSTVNITVNPMAAITGSGPAITNLSAISPDVYVAGSSTPIVINNQATLSDNLDNSLNYNLGNYSNSQLTIARSGGLNNHDLFSFAAMQDVTVSGNTLIAGGNVIANVTNYAGQLQLEFVNTGTIPTRALVNEIMQAIQYSNSGTTPPSAVNLVYSFNDGTNNSTASIATATTTVNITTLNTAPSITVPSAQVVIENTLNQTTGTVQFNGNISFSDQYNTSNTLETVMLSANHRVLSFSNIMGLTNITNNSGIITATGTIANLNTALSI